jgi:glycosyltransferase involved in cell wall biosynthesis
MLITIAICTFNRAESLRRTLDSLLAMRLSEDIGWEVVVVNNNCTDHTDQVIASFANRLPIRQAFEAEPGQSNARNRAVEAARGDYIIWTDDDVIVDPEWLRGYFEAFRRWPEAAIFGGPIIPRYEPPVVTWVMQSETLLAGAYAARDCGDEALPLCLA